MERINVEQDSELARGFNLIDAICDILSQHINVQQDKSPNRKRKETATKLINISKNMIILFGNQKGGCGKTTNCIQFANYLVEKGKEVLVLDLDFQRSLSDRRKEDIATYDNEPKYEVIQTDISNVAKIISDFTKVEQGNLLIDLPG